MIGKKCIVRTYSAGVFYGTLISLNKKIAVIKNARRLWQWAGAASLSQLAVDGVKDPENCKFPISVDELMVTEVIEIIPTTEKADKSINAVPVWQI